MALVQDDVGPRVAHTRDRLRGVRHTSGGQEPCGDRARAARESERATDEHGTALTRAFDRPRRPCERRSLGRDEVDQYLAHRLRVAGFRGNRLFTRPASRLVHRFSDGVPRLINIIAHKAMMLAYGEGAQQVTPLHVRKAAADTPAARERRPWWWFGFAMLFLSVAGSLGWIYLS